MYRVEYGSHKEEFGTIEEARAFVLDLAHPITGPFAAIAKKHGDEHLLVNKKAEENPDFYITEIPNEESVIYNRSVKDIAYAAGLSQRALARRFEIPYRTMEEWGRGNNKCPLYVRLMMQECLGLYKPE